MTRARTRNRDHLEVSLLDPTETSLIGEWYLRGALLTPDATCVRIDQLVRNHLLFMGSADHGWSRLHRDPADGRFWELTYPQGHMHGGGPPALCCLSRDDALTKYGEVV
jgi:hypothetical protein